MLFITILYVRKKSKKAYLSESETRTELKDLLWGNRGFRISRENIEVSFFTGNVSNVKVEMQVTGASLDTDTLRGIAEKTRGKLKDIFTDGQVRVTITDLDSSCSAWAI